MSFHDVSDYLDISVLELREITASLGSGGLVQEMSEDRLQVRPPAIRAVLVRDVFFRGPTALKIDALLDKVNSLASTATVLLSARQRGAEIDQSLLEQFVTAAGSYDVWGRFAWVDARCANAVLDRYPEKVCHAAPGLLNHSPHRALHALLDADDADRLLKGAAEHPRRQISEWLFPIDESPHVTIDRRRILLDVLEERVRSNRVGKGQSFTWALAEILQARFDVTTPSPGSNRIIRCRRGVASPAVLDKIGSLWPRINELFRRAPNAAARILFDRLEDWCIPKRLSIASEVSGETCEMVRSHACRILSDLLDMPHCNRAWRTRAATMAKWGELDLQIEVDPTFDALYADRDLTGNWEQEWRNRLSELDVLANELIKRPLEEALQYLADLRAEAIEFGYREGSGYLWAVYHQIAQKCDKPIEWFDALIRRNAQSDFLAPFLDRLSASDSIQHEATLGRLLEHPDYQSLAIGRVLPLQPPNNALLSSAIGLLGERNPVRQFRLHDPSIPLEVMIRLLTHPDSSVRAAAAIGEWQRNEGGTIRPELEAQWRIAILDADSSHYALTEIFAKMPTLAFEWLRSQIQKGSHLFPEDPTLRAADRYLSKVQRAELLRLFTRENYSDACFDLVLGEHTDLFAGWLDYQTDEHVRLSPLDRYVGPRWEHMALLALDAGISPEKLADHCWPNPWEAGSQVLIERIPAYEALANHSDPRLRPAGERRLTIIRAYAKSELERERREETYGE
jgi:hypothetical protein